MSSPADTKVDPSTNSDQSKMLEHLQAPRKKRKNYVFIAIGRDVDLNTANRIEQYLNLNFPQYAVYAVQTIDDLAKLTSKLTNLIVVSDGFGSFDETMPILQEFKKTNFGTAVPVLFLTANEEALIIKYKQYLGIYQETDDYLNSHNLSEKHLFAKIFDRLSIKGPMRKGRRFPVQLHVRYKELQSDKVYTGLIEDISMYGCLLVKDDSMPHFKKNDQFRIYLPNDGYFPLENGESVGFYGFSSRVLLGGERTGVEWAHLSEEKHSQLFRILTEIQSRSLINAAVRERNAQKIKKNVKA